MIEEDPTKIDINFDPMRQRMDGITRSGGLQFDVPFISHITGNLYQGGCEQGLILPQEIEHVISLYPWESYRTPGRMLKSMLSIQMYDTEDGQPDEAEIRALAKWVARCVDDGPTLVHCQAGLNRSALVAGAYLILEQKMDPSDVIDILRTYRSSAVLCNRTFEIWLRSLRD